MSKTKGQLEEIFAQLGQKMDQLVDLARTNKDQAMEDIEENIQWIKDRWQEIREEQRESSVKERWERAQPHIKSAFHEIGEAFRNLSKGKS